MRGCDADPGMMILCIRDIIEWVDSHPQIKYKLLVSYMEVYNEEINDLLGVVGPASKNLRIVSEDAARGAVIGNLVEEVVKTPADFMEVLQRGEASRSYASTTMNAESSRSHTIYRVTVQRVDVEDPNEPSIPIPLGQKDTGAAVRISYLNLVDLAGSERQKSTNASGKTLKEGANINKSLLALGAVINKLGESSKKPAKGAKPIFIPYRDSKLTRILKQSLGGNTMTSILCAVTGAGMHREETVSTLKFGQLCKTIKNNVKSNEVVDERSLLKQYRSKISDLELKLEEYERGGGSGDNNPNWIKEKSELEATIQALKIGGGGDGEQIDNSTAFIEALQEQKAENARQTAKISEQQRLITRLNTDLEEFNELDEAKTAFEEYQTSSASELEDLKVQVDNDKQSIQADRYKILSERANLEEKESRLAILLTTLDERDSKLRQMQATLKEQLEQWQRSIVDLQRREDLVDDWQNNHRDREKRISEMDEEREIKFNELLTREGLLAEHEQKFKLSQRELQEREQRLQVALSRVANAEQTAASIEEKLRASEASLKKRGNESDIKEREMLSRRREMESWDILLKEKDKKVSVQQRTLDEKVESLRVMDEKARLRESDIDIKESDLKRIDETFKEDRKVWNQKVVATDNHERELNEKEKKIKKIEENHLAKESDLSKWEKKLIGLQEKLKDIDVKDNELSKRIDDHAKVEAEFFNTTVGKITQRHSKELTHLEGLVAKVSNFNIHLSFIHLFYLFFKKIILKLFSNWEWLVLFKRNWIILDLN
jgi:centromeric protein E